MDSGRGIHTLCNYSKRFFFGRWCRETAGSSFILSEFDFEYSLYVVMTCSAATVNEDARLNQGQASTHIPEGLIFWRGPAPKLFAHHNLVIYHFRLAKARWHLQGTWGVTRKWIFRRLPTQLHCRSSSSLFARVKLRKQLHWGADGDWLRRWRSWRWWWMKLRSISEKRKKQMCVPGTNKLP